MSLAALGGILENMRLDVSDTEIEILDHSMKMKYSILGLDHCGKLEDEYEKEPEQIECDIREKLRIIRPEAELKEVVIV